MEKNNNEKIDNTEAISISEIPPEKIKEALEWKKGFMSFALVEKSYYEVLFPKYRESYLSEIWPGLVSILKKHEIRCELNLPQGKMSAETTRKTWDPFIILKVRDLLKLLARSVPLAQGIRILEDGVGCDIIKIDSFVSSKERFLKRRQRLIGPNGATLKALELLTKCYIIVQGNTVATLGPIKSLKDVKKIVEDCMCNIHPVYNIKTLMIKNELLKNEELKTESWDRFLPKFKRLVQKKKITKPKKKKKEYTPFPPPQQPRKIDLEMATGEYFIRQEKEREAAKLAKIQEKKDSKRNISELDSNSQDNKTNNAKKLKVTQKKQEKQKEIEADIQLNREKRRVVRQEKKLQYQQQFKPTKKSQNNQQEETNFKKTAEKIKIDLQNKKSLTNNSKSKRNQSN
eukprot:TRINITY_DN25_c1_g2_i1.p1 TRINITY_DN25_c1_g2~~TRINITY_DN25_c1_g2_i1.p1  ORF type:complete len:401 (-),score=180.60 TRINITY_DN25_c1_g2_i1:29-1231(-)